MHLDQVLPKEAERRCRIKNASRCLRKALRTGAGIPAPVQAQNKGKTGYPSVRNRVLDFTTSRTWLSTVRQQPPTALAPARIQRRA